MKNVGLTGNIGTGKTTVAWMFEEQGAKLLNADAIAHEAIAPHTAVWKQLFDRYGKKIMIEGGVIERKTLARIIFSDENERKFVESVIHPKVHEELTKRIADSKRNGTQLLIVEVPLLFETRWDKEMDSIIVVSCDLELQVKRCQEKFGLTREEVLQRIKAQRPIEQKIAKADYVVDNSGSMNETFIQVRRIYSSLMKGEFHPKR
jgi:dephospho-CoA kinase